MKRDPIDVIFEHYQDEVESLSARWQKQELTAEQYFDEWRALKRKAADHDFLMRLEERLKNISG